MPPRVLHDDFDLHWRRRYIEQAEGKRPRLRQNLRQLGAVGPLKPPNTFAHQPLVKTRHTFATGSTGAHLSYLQVAKGLAQSRAPLYGPGAGDLVAFRQQAQQDPHQFRLIVMGGDATLDRELFIGLFMAQVTRDLGRPLDWVAADHYDTAHPHTHLVLRGRDLHGQEVYMNKHYFTEGLKYEASRILTLIFGLRQSQERQRAFEAEQTLLNGLVQGPLDPDHLQHRQQQMDIERGRLNGFVRGPDDPDHGRTRLDLLRDLQTQPTSNPMLQATQTTPRAVAAELAALDQRMQVHRMAQQAWLQRSQQYGQGR